MTWKDVTAKQYTENRWNWKEDEGEMIGEYIGVVSMPGKFGKNFNVHSVKSEVDNNIWEFLGTTVLDNKLTQVESGTKVRIVSLGMIEGEKGQRYYDWTVQTWED